MIDLHLHLDGSLSKEDFIYLADKQNINLGNDFPNNIYVSKDCKSLEEYLEKFDLPLKLMQTSEALEYCTYSLVTRLYELGYIYAEIRYAPLLHLEQGLTMSQVVEATIRGLKKGLLETKNFDANLILCCMRHAPKELNLETVEMANTYKNDKVVAVDLAGAEALHPSSYFKEVFDLAKQYKLNITIHAGEATGSDEIMQAIDNGAMRIGHGVHLSLDEHSISKVKEHNICFEFCPTSNLQTKSLKTYNDVPIEDFFDNDIPFTINADNMTVSNVTAIEDTKEMIKTFDLNLGQVRKILNNSIKYSFASLKTKIELQKALETRLNEYFFTLTK